MTTTVSAQAVLARLKVRAASTQRCFFISVVSPWTMHVSVRKFFCSGIPYVHEIDIKIQVLAGERMITVNGNHVAGNGGYGHGARPLLRLGMQAHSDSDLVDSLEGTPRHLLNELVTAFAVTVRRRHFDSQFLAGALAFQLALETGNQVAVAVQIGERL